MLKWTVGHRKTEGPKSPSGPCYSIRRALHLARRSRTPGRDKENKGHGSHRHSQCLSPRTRDSVYMCLEAIPAALRDISNQHHTHGPTASNQYHTHGPTASNRYHTHGPTASNRYNTHGPTASNQYHTHGPTASNQYHTHGPTASKRCCSQGRRTRTAPRDYKHGDRETRRDLVSTPRRISLSDVDSKSTLISSTSLPPLRRSDITSPSRLMQIDYSPCPMKTTKSLLALRRRLVDAFNQSSSSSVGTPHLAPQLCFDNPLYFALRDGPCPGPVNRALSTSGKVEGTTPSCEAIPHKIRKRSLARFPSGIEREEADDHTHPVSSEFSNQGGHRGATWSSMHVLSMNLASLSLSNASRDGSLSLPSSRITPPSPFLNSTHASSISSTNQHDLLKACVPARRDSRLKAFVPILEDSHDLTDPRFLSHLTFMEATVMPAKNSSIFHGFQKVRLSKGFRGSSAENEPAQTSSYLEFVDSGVDMTRSNDEYSVRSRRYSLRKRNSTRRVRTVTSTSEDGPPIKVQSVESDIGLSVIPFSGEVASLDASRSCHTPANSEYCQKILRHRKSFRSSARRSRRNSLKGIGDGVFKRENTICDSIFNECGRKDLYNLNSSGDSLDRSFSLRRQGGFRRKNRGFVTGEAARSCTDVTTTCQMTTHSLLGAPSPFSVQREGGTVSIPGITNTTFTVQGFNRGSPEPDKLDQPSSRDKGSSLTLPKGIPSPPSPTCHSVELTSPTGMDAICPLATSPGPQGGMERAVALWEGANPITNVWQRNEWRMNGLKDGNMSTSPSDETWNSHTMNALRTPVLTSGHILRSSYTTISTDRQEGRDVAESPLALVEHRSRSRRCLLFASPGSSTRHCRSSKRRGSWKKSRECCQDRGELELALYENHGLLTIHVISGKNLRRPGGKSCNAYVKVNLVPSTEERTFHRTPVHRNCSSPLFDQKFSVELLEGDVDKRVLVSVWHRDRERRRSEFLGCMSFAVKHAIKKDISGSYRLSSQTSGRPQPVAMPRHSISSTEEVISLDSDVPVRTGMEGGRACPKKPVDCKPAGAEDSTFLRHLELEPLPEEGEGPPLPLKGGRTPFTTTRRLVRNPSVGGGFGFSIAWTQPPRVERVETGLPADQAGLLPGDYVIFVEKDNVVTLPEEEILQLIRSCGNEVTLEVYRRTTPNGLVGSSTLTATGVGSGVVTAPPQPSTTTCSVTTASLDLSKRRLHLPQVTFSSETEPLNREETRRRAVYQLLYKEQHYAMCLQFGISRFLLPLAERKDLLTPQEHVLLFQNVDELLRLTEDTLEQLVHEESEALGQHLGRVYLKKTPSLNSAYRRYFSGIKKADCLLAAKTRNSHFMRIVLEPAVPRRRPDLTSFLHKPLEHYRDILKLLQTILNNAKVTDDEYPALARVVQEMQSMYRDVTMGSGLMEPEGEGRPLLSLQDLESRLVFTRCKPFVLSSPGRQWIFGGDLSRVEGRATRPFWALLFSDLILFTKVSRDRVLFITEEPLSLLSVTQAFFNIRKKDNEFRLQVDGAPEGTDSPAQGGCGPELQLTRSNKKNTRKRAVTLRAPTAELKAVWQNLIQRQIIYLNTTRGGTPASSPLESPDPPTTLSVATLDSLPLRRQAPVPDYKSLDELIEHKCRQLGKSGAHKGSALHLEQWMKGKLGAGGPLTPEDEPEPEVWSLETLRRRSEQLQLGLIGRSDSRCEEVDVSDTERSQSRSTERSRSDSQVTVRSGGLEQPVAVCRQCHKTCLASSPGDLEDDDDDLDGNWGPLILMGMSALNATIGLGAGATAGIAPADPFSPSELPLISVLPPTPDTLPRNSSLQWEDSDLSLIVVSSPSGSSPSPDTTQVQETPEEEDSGEEGGQEEPPYRALSSPPGLKRYGTLASLRMLESDEEDDVEGEWRSEEEEDQSVGGSNQQMEAMTLSLRGWTTRAGSYVAEKMALFEDSRAAAFLDRYLRPTAESPPEQNTTSFGTGELEECDTSVGTSGEEVWGTPTSGGDLDEELSFPSVDTPKVSVSDFLADSASLTGVGDDDTELMMDELLATPPLACGGVRVFPQRRRLEPLPEEEDTDSPGSPPCSPTTLQDQDTPSPEQGNGSGGVADSYPAAAKSINRRHTSLFNRLRMRRPREEVRRAKTNRLFMFLSGGRRGPGVEENHSGGGRQPPPLFRLFRGAKEHVDNIPTSLPRQMTPRRENEKQLERRFWKQLRRRRSESVISPSRVAT